MAWQRIAVAVPLAGLAAAPAANAHELSGTRTPLASLPALPAPSSSDDAPDLRAHRRGGSSGAAEPQQRPSQAP